MSTSASKVKTAETGWHCKLGELLMVGGKINKEFHDQIEEAMQKLSELAMTAGFHPLSSRVSFVIQIDGPPKVVRVGFDMKLAESFAKIGNRLNPRLAVSNQFHDEVRRCLHSLINLGMPSQQYPHDRRVTLLLHFAKGWRKNLEGKWEESTEFGLIIAPGGTA